MSSWHFFLEVTPVISALFHWLEEVSLSLRGRDVRSLLGVESKYMFTMILSPMVDMGDDISSLCLFPALLLHFLRS